ncbi:metalloreductase STEAP3 isoform X2 [Exaiptasia diaphana]|nr:metalloreductase STEAP3 isoform X2 [Exaiptasia diaphana]XP_028516722.1 metalloreductase STEAP3 isoform X2 [Exaiptasia diaphana]KXJ25407.1 Metalloreductase STEAP3 [Exaiptasia diaphana]
MSINEQPIVIVGTGDFGRALATRLHRFGFKVVLGSRNPSTVEAKVIPQNVEVLENKEALQRGNIIIFAVHRQSYEALANEYRDMLKEKIVVDVNNPQTSKKGAQSSGEYLGSLLPESKVVKAFNVISAWALESDSFGGSKQVPLCSNNAEARRIIFQLVRDIGFEPIDRGSLKTAEELESIPFRFFPSWISPVAFSFILLLVITLYEFLRRYVNNGSVNIRWENFPVSKLNIYFGFNAIGLLYLAYLPGSLAGILQLINGTKRKRFPNWLDQWMKARKQLGLMGFFFALLHAIMAVLIMNSAFAGSFYENYKVQVQNITIKQPAKLSLNGELSMFFGIVAFCLLCLLAVCSLPSVINTMSWREWNFAQSGIGHVMIVCAFCHMLTMGTFSMVRRNWKFSSNYRLPSVFYIEIGMGFFVIFLRLLLYVPCLYIPLQKIRHGWERSANGNVKPKGGAELRNYENTSV